MGKTMNIVSIIEIFALFTLGVPFGVLVVIDVIEYLDGQRPSFFGLLWQDLKKKIRGSV